MWTVWLGFCASLGIDPYLSQFKDPIPILQVFAHRVRTGQLAKRGKPVKKRQVEAHLRAVGQTFTSMGAHDPRHDDQGRLHFVLYRQLRSYTRSDPAPARVKPIPTRVLYNVFERYISGTAEHHCIADLVWVAFFFLMRPGEYCDAGQNNDSTPFRLCDVVFRTGQTTHHTFNTPISILSHSTHVALTFSNQKNGVKGESIGHSATSHATACPVRRIAHRVAYLRARGASHTSPLCCYHNGHQWRTVKSAAFTTALRHSITLLSPGIGLTPDEVSARSLRASGAMALLLGGIDTDTIGLIGRWRSGALLRYLHVTARAITHNHSHTMLQQGNYELLSSASSVLSQHQGTFPG